MIENMRSARLMDPKETAEYLHLDEKTITRWARKSYIPAHPLGEGKRRFWRFFEHELSAWLLAQSNGAATQAIQSFHSSTQPAPIATACIHTSEPSFPAESYESAQGGGRLRSQRYQRGSLSILKNKHTPHVWAFRYYTNEKGRRVYKRKTIGTVLELPTRKDAERAVSQLRIAINERPDSAPINVERLAAHFETVEIPFKAHSTSQGYKTILSHCVIPRWGQCSVHLVKSGEVEFWLRNLARRDGQQASPATRSKVRNVMSALFSHAVRYGWTQRNPITPVRTSAKRLREPETLTPAEFRALLHELPQRERLMVLIAGSTGLRRGELIGLRWSDVDFEQRLISVTRSIWQNVEGEPKTSASRKPVPLHPTLVNELKNWKESSPYKSEKDFLFPSLATNGKHPVEPNMILRNYITPALARLNVPKRIGWHSFRHGFSNLLRQTGADIKTTQDLLRHANSRVTLDFYQQSITEERRSAQSAVVKVLIGGQDGQNSTRVGRLP